MIKSTIKVLTILLFLLSSSLFAGELEQLITKKSESSNQNSLQLNTPSSSFSNPQYDISLYADFLYWGVKTGNLSFAESGITEASAASGQGVVKSIKTSWDPGFKVGAMAFFEHDHWDMKFEYTRIVSKDHASAGSGYYPLWNIGNAINGDTSITAESSKATWNQSFNALDINLGRRCYVSKYLMIRPFIGIQGMYNTEHFRVSDQNVTTTSLDANTNLLMHINQFYWGIGIETGMNTLWSFNKSFGLYGNFLISALSSNFDTTRKDYLYFVTSPTVSHQMVNTESSFNTLKAFFDLGLGLCYEYNRDTWGIYIKAGWEALIGMNYNQFINIEPAFSDNGDLTMQGLTLEIGVSF